MKAYGTWVASHGLMRLAFKDASRRGELVARLSLDPALRDDPYPAYEALRGNGRIHRTRQVSATVSHPVANAILRSDDFGTMAGRAGLPKLSRTLMTRFSDPYAVGPVDPPSLLAVDGEQHTRYRRLVSRAFTARNVAGLADRVEGVAERLLDDVGGTFDLVDRYAAQLPVAVIADLLGVPEGERAQVLAWGNEAAVLHDPGLTWRQWKRAHDTIRDMHAWFQAHLERLRRDPGDDLLSRLAVMSGAGHDPRGHPRHDRARRTRA